MAVAESEHVLKLVLKDGRVIKIYRAEDLSVHICGEDHCAVLPKASGQVTLDLFAILAPFGEIEEKTDGST